MDKTAQEAFGVTMLKYINHFLVLANVVASNWCLYRGDELGSVHFVVLAILFQCWAKA